MDDSCLNETNGKIATVGDVNGTSSASNLKKNSSHTLQSSSEKVKKDGDIGTPDVLSATRESLHDKRETTKQSGVMATTISDVLNSKCGKSKPLNKQASQSKWQEIEPDSDTDEVGVVDNKLKTRPAARRITANPVKSEGTLVASSKECFEVTEIDDDLDDDVALVESDSKVGEAPASAPSKPVEEEGRSADDGGEEEEKDEEVDDDDHIHQIRERKRMLAVKKLNSLIEKLNAKIKSLEEKELTLDDMRSESIYTHLELYKKKLVMAWKKVRELTQQPSDTGRETEKPFSFKDTSYPQINKAITKFVNKYHSFPDYQDIYDIVSTCNDYFTLKLSKQTIYSISGSAFTIVGKALKKRRIRDFKDTFGCHITDELGLLKDPASEDPELKKKLDENKRKADGNMEKTFIHFESLPDKKCEEDDDDDSDDDDDRSDEEEEEDDDNNETIQEKCTENKDKNSPDESTRPKEDAIKVDDEPESPWSEDDEHVKDAVNKMKAAIKCKPKSDQKQISSNDNKSSAADDTSVNKGVIQVSDEPESPSTEDEEPPTKRDVGETKTTVGKKKTTESMRSTSSSSVRVLDIRSSEESDDAMVEKKSLSLKDMIAVAAVDAGISEWSARRASSTNCESKKSANSSDGKMRMSGSRDNDLISCSGSLSSCDIAGGSKKSDRRSKQEVEKKSGLVEVRPPLKRGTQCPRVADRVKKRKLSDEGPRQSIACPSFICLQDEINKQSSRDAMEIPKEQSDSKQSLKEQIQKALTTSRVVLRNCMSCKVVCCRNSVISVNVDTSPKKSAGSGSERLLKGKRRKPGSDGPATKDADKKLCCKNVSLEELTRDEVEEVPLESNNPSVKETNPAVPDVLLSPQENPESVVKKCNEILNEVKKDEVERDSKSPGNVGDVYENVVGEVLTYQSFDNFEEGGEISKDDEGLVKAVASLVKEPTAKMSDENKSREVETCAVVEVVDLEECDSKNEDAVVFLGSYSVSHSAASSNQPQVLYDEQTSTQARSPTSSSCRSRRSLPRNRRQNTRLAPYSRNVNFAQNDDNMLSPESSEVHRGSAPRAAVPSDALSGLLGSSEVDDDLIARLLDASALPPNVQAQKLPAKVIKQINNFTRQLTGANKGKGRKNPMSRSRLFPSYTAKHFVRPAGFFPGATYASASASTGGARLNRVRQVGNHSNNTHTSNVPMTDNCVACPQTALNSFKRRMMKNNAPRSSPVPHASTATSSGIQTRKSNVSASRDASYTAVVIDDDDSNPQGHASTSARLINNSVTTSTSTQRQDRISLFENFAGPSKNNEATFDVQEVMMSSVIQSTSIRTLTVQQHKFQQKTQSFDSDVIMCDEFFQTPTDSWERTSSSRPETLPAAASDLAPRSSNEHFNDDSPVPNSTLKTLLFPPITIGDRGSTSLGTSIQSASYPADSSLARSFQVKTVSSDSDVIFCEDGVDQLTEETIAENQVCLEESLSTYSMSRQITSIRQDFVTSLASCNSRDSDNVILLD